VVEALVTVSPEFFKGKKRAEVKGYFDYALEFIKAHQNPKTIISATVHMDEKTPHMHLCFVPLTEDGRLSAKDIVGNKKKLTWWQDEFWKHMVKKYPELERGESASETGRQHIPPRLYKEAIHLNSLKDRIMELLSGMNPLNAKSRTAEITGLLDEYIPGVEKMKTRLKKYDTEYKTLTAENAALESKLEAAEDAGREKIANRLKYAGMEQELRDLHALVDSIPKKIFEMYQSQKHAASLHEPGKNGQQYK